MTAPLNPEIKAIRALVRALEPLHPAARERVVDWLHAHTHRTTQDRVRAALRSVKRELDA